MADPNRVAEMPKNPSAKVVFSTTDYKGSTYVDIREYVESATYTGFTKKGIRFHVDRLDDFIVCLNKVKTAVSNAGPKPNPAETL